MMMMIDTLVLNNYMLMMLLMTMMIMMIDTPILKDYMIKMMMMTDTPVLDK